MQTKRFIPNVLGLNSNLYKTKILRHTVNKHLGQERLKGLTFVMLQDKHLCVNSFLESFDDIVSSDDTFNTAWNRARKGETSMKVYTKDPDSVWDHYAFEELNDDGWTIMQINKICEKNGYKGKISDDEISISWEPFCYD